MAQRRAAGRWGAIARWLAPGLAVVGCASAADRLALPLRTGDDARPRVVDGRGELPPRQADAVVARLERDDPGTLIARHLAFMERAGAPPLIAGNATRLLIDGPETHRAMFEAIAAARRHVLVQTYILESDATGERLAELLIERRRQGVPVSLIYDAIGGLGTPSTYFERLREAGVAVCESNPVNPLAGRGVTLNNRDHRKILVVDGRVAFTGGINISDVYASGSASARRRTERGGGWRDTHLQVRGPAVAAFERLFVDSWSRQRCEPAPGLAGGRSTVAAAGDRVLRVVATTPEDRGNAIHAEWLSAFRHAQRSIHVTMAYFVPDPSTLEALEAAARRGVDVQLVLPGFSDFWAVLHAGRSHYTRLLDAGVRIHERRDALLHAKTAVVDGVWSTVGSANMDWRSFLHNEEINVIVIGEGFGGEMQRMFETDLAASVPVDPAAWARRGPLERLKEQVARAFEHWL